jgi:hypothetical protein
MHSRLFLLSFLQMVEDILQNDLRKFVSPYIKLHFWNSKNVYPFLYFQLNILFI